MPSAEQLSSTIEKIYAAAADPALWEDALRSIEDYTGSTSAVLVWSGKRRPPRR